MNPALLLVLVLAALGVIVSGGVGALTPPVAAGIALSVVVESLVRYVGRGGQWERERRDHAAAKDGRIANPFMNYTPVNYFRLRYIWPGLLLIPLRMAWLIGTLVSVSLYGMFAKAVVGQKALKKPLTGWRAWVVKPIRLAARSLLFALGFNWIRVWGKQAKRQEAAIIVGNHRGLFEALFLLQNDCTMLSSSDNRFPVVCHALDALQFMFVNNRDPASRGQTAELLQRRATEPGWPQVMLFPEGTTTNGRALVQFRPGAFKPGVPVQPVAFDFPNDTMDVDPSWTFGVHGPMFGIFTIFVRLMSSWHNPMHVHFLEPHRPTEEERADPILFAEHVRQRIADALRIPCTEHGQDDVALMLEAQKCKLDPDQFAVEFSNIKKVYGELDRARAKEMLRKFAEVSSKDGFVGKKRFAELSGLPEGPGLDCLFGMLASEEYPGKVNFKAWLAGVAKVSEKLNGPERASICFDAFDLDRSGTLTREELFIMLRLGFQDVTQEHAEEIWKLMVKYDPEGKGEQVSKEAFLKFLRENERYMLLFDLLSEESTSALGAATASRLATSRRESFIRRRASFIRKGAASSG
eukprot:TRINITY_DN55977_c0_g1_i1.p1 TRINITY_DN55977_c0_g1~~TRINITY_DN55977_c0_g1_i1.p1  ORF type:complete len:610 (+),score=220.60 TRINITY_DN55977_c0_g1_i1:93-1832(+)